MILKVIDSQIRTALADARGVSALEYGVLLASIFIVIVLGSQPITSGIREFLAYVLNNISAGV